MNFDYVIKLDMSLEQAWETLMDIERIAPCMPGATIESHDGDDYVGRLKVKLGPMEMTYRGNIHFVERDDAAKTALIDAAAKEIKGRGAAKTQVSLRGAAVDQGSEITLSSEFTVSGKAAQFGRGVMEEVGEKLMGDFATRLAAQVTADAGAAAPDDDAPLTAALPSKSSDPDPIEQQPVPVSESASQNTAVHTSTENEALDIGGAAMWPVLRRLAIPAVVIAIVAAIYLSL
jgi:carbon monoxide dehydrogenase subunit G